MSANQTYTSIPEWIPLENRFYRRCVQYSQLEWTLRPQDFTNAIVSAAPCAGPIALIPESGWGLSYALAVYTLSGRLVQRFDKLRSRTVPPFRAIAAGWSTDDLLTVVYSDGVVLRIPSGLHVKESQAVEVESTQNEIIFDAVVTRTGDVVLRASGGTIYVVNSFNKVITHERNIPPPEPSRCGAPTSGIAVLGSDPTQPTPDMLLLTDTSKIAMINSLGISYTMGEREISCFAVSQNGQYLASIEPETGTLNVLTVDLRTEVAKINLVLELAVLGVENVLSDHVFDAKTPVTIAWVGSDAIAVIYTEHLVLAGPHGAIAALPLTSRFESGGVVLQQEIDGLRLISSSCVHFVQMVPQQVNSVFRETQTPGYKLLLCSGGVMEGSSTTVPDALTRYRLLRELRESDGLLEGSRSCVAAAYLEMNVKNQKRLLRAAAYGQRHASVFGLSDEEKEQDTKQRSLDLHIRKKTEVRRSDTNMVPTAVAILRVLNASSSAPAAIPVTKPQFDILGLRGLVARLSRYGQYSLAIRLAFFTGISPSDVLSDWATAVANTNPVENDESVTNLIIGKFESVSRSHIALGLHGSVSNRALPYVQAAEAALAAGRPKCAELLLRKENRPARKVSLLLKMGREGPAIVASVASGDPELVLDALGSILERRKVRETARLLRSLPPALGTRAADLFATHLKQIGDMNALTLLYAEIGRRREAALVEIYKADIKEDPGEHLEALHKSAVTIAKGYGRRTCNFEVQALQHAKAVAVNAMEVEKIGKLEQGSLRDANDGDLLARAALTITDVGSRREMLTRLRRELRVPDRRFFWVCLHSMAEAGDFDSIEDLSLSAGYGRPPPIGLTAFVDTCIKYRKEDEAVKYALRIADLRERARALARCGRGREAAEIASRLRNQQLLEEVQDLAGRHVPNVAIPQVRNVNGTAT